jgi:hypothetical protein
MRKKALIYHHQRKKKTLSTNRLTARDIEILKKLVECRVMSSAQIFDLFFPGPSASRGRERLRYLLSLKVVRRLELPTLVSEGRKPYVYTPTQHILEYIDADIIDTKPITESYLFLSHLLDIAEVNVQLSKACKQHGYILKWWNELELERGPLIPDAVYEITTPLRPFRFVLEVDRSRETLKIIEEKMIKYRFYFDTSNGPSPYQQRWGDNTGRVQWVTKSTERQRNIKDICEAQGGRTRYWFSTLSSLQANDPLYTPVWYKAGAPHSETFSLI